jgi:hypothetical protein
MASASKDFKKVIREAEAQGWRVEPTKNGHWRFYAPNGRDIVHAAGTPSDYRSLENFLAQMRRAGFVWRGR